jgi:hypothetical protein
MVLFKLEHMASGIIRRCLEKINYIVGVKTISHLFEDAG